ncbi:MAG: hypothetical protein HZY76_07550 [Anaerolineae bacterium]|nr:MAG: hypothetical protein HZY76_07550 [Anaerolineae bacterium]
MTIFSKLTPVGLKFVQAHEGIKEIRETEDGTYELVLQDGNVVGATVDGEQLTLMIPEDEASPKVIRNISPVTQETITKMLERYEFAGRTYLDVTSLEARTFIDEKTHAKIVLSSQAYNKLLETLPTQDLTEDQVKELVTDALSKSALLENISKIESLLSINEVNVFLSMDPEKQP